MRHQPIFSVSNLSRSRTRSISIAALGLGMGLLVSACGDDDDSPTPTPSDPAPSDPGDLSTILFGNLVNDGAGEIPNAAGMVSIAENAGGTRFIVLGGDFMQEEGPGDTQIILANGSDNVATQRGADPTSVSPSVGTVVNGFAGAATFEVPSSVDALAFSHLIIWCPTAGVNFGVAELMTTDVGGPLEVRASSLVADGAGGLPDATGTVRIVREGSTLSIELGDDFMQEEGPGDTQLILARTGDNVQAQRDDDPTSASPSLGTIPNAASGARTFEIPADVDLDDFDYAIVWCPSARANFGAAQLPKRSGTLVADGAGGLPDATGGVTFGRDASGALTVELADDFMQEIGPGDTQIILASSDDNVDDQRAASALVSPSVGTVPNGASGAMSFVVPDEVQVDLYSHLIVWCPTAGVNFGATELQ